MPCLAIFLPCPLITLAMAMTMIQKWNQRGESRRFITTHPSFSCKLLQCIKMNSYTTHRWGCSWSWFYYDDVIKAIIKCIYQGTCHNPSLFKLIMLNNTLTLNVSNVKQCLCVSVRHDFSRWGDTNNRDDDDHTEGKRCTHCIHRSDIMNHVR